LRILDLLKKRELCGTEIVTAVGEKLTTVSRRLNLLRSEGLIVGRREGNHIYCALVDQHVVDLILNALAHAKEFVAARRRSNAPLTTEVSEFALVLKAQHRIEECLKRAKGEAGLGDYQVRT
jgi:DNA-binding transcriptional ArsR family regulator